VSDIVVRAAHDDDAIHIAAVFGEARRAAMPTLPILHTFAEDTAFFARIVRACTTLVAATDHRFVVGFCAVTPRRIEHLYVRPAYHRRGIGTALLTRALDDGRKRDLWVFRCNRPAIAFYERHGYRCVETTDGANNAEREPDARYAL
jgi:GNAT superfamily N-acetyltransferase